MNTKEFIEIMDSGAEVIAFSEVHQYMTYLSTGDRLRMGSFV